MATKNKTAKTTAAPKPAKPTLVKILAQPAKPYRTNSARHLYWQACQQYNGKPLSELVAALENPKTCPLVSPKRGAPEPGKGWVAFYQRSGMLGLV